MRHGAQPKLISAPAEERRNIHVTATKMNGSRLALSFCHRKWFATSLAEKQIFHIGSVM
jgi:hypothetical protein